MQNSFDWTVIASAMEYEISGFYRTVSIKNSRAAIYQNW
jgi:hypothetical protein